LKCRKPEKPKAFAEESSTRAVSVGGVAGEDDCAERRGQAHAAHINTQTEKEGAATNNALQRIQTLFFRTTNSRKKAEKWKNTSLEL
jgi:hypothetical protein